MQIIAIAAVAEDRALGKNNDLLWHLPNDFKRFKQLTTGHYIIMGRKTFESMSSKPLTGRLNIVITRQNNWGEDSNNFLVAKSLEHALEMAKTADCKEVFVIGGGEIYRQVLPIANRIYLTRVHASFPNADTFFAPIDTHFFELSEQTNMQADEKHAFAYTFQIWDRRQ